MYKFLTAEIFNRTIYWSLHSVVSHHQVKSKSFFLSYGVQSSPSVCHSYEVTLDPSKLFSLALSTSQWHRHFYREIEVLSFIVWKNEKLPLFFFNKLKAKQTDKQTNQQNKQR